MTTQISTRAETLWAKLLVVWYIIAFPKPAVNKSRDGDSTTNLMADLAGKKLLSQPETQAISYQF
jgi:hypothetical protein